MEENDLRMNLLFEIADLIHDRSQIFNKYRKVRKLHQEVIESMMDYADDNNIVPDHVLGILKRNFELNFDDHLDSHVYGDLIVYPQIPEFECITKRYLDLHYFSADDKVKMLESMMNSYYSIFTFVKRKEEDGLVTLYDVIKRENIEIIDGKFGVGYHGNEYILLRIIQFGDIKFQTGIIMTYSRDKRSAKLIRKVINNYNDHYTETFLDLYDNYIQNN